VVKCYSASGLFPLFSVLVRRFYRHRHRSACWISPLVPSYDKDIHKPIANTNTFPTTFRHYLYGHSPTLVSSSCRVIVWRLRFGVGGISLLSSSLRLIMLHYLRQKIFVSLSVFRCSVQVCYRLLQFALFLNYLCAHKDSAFGHFKHRRLPCCRHWLAMRDH
jgi:hypothetical protein